MLTIAWYQPPRATTVTHPSSPWASAMPIDLSIVWIIPISLQTSAVIHGLRARLQSAPAEHSLNVVFSSGGDVWSISLQRVACGGSQVIGERERDCAFCSNYHIKANRAWVGECTRRVCVEVGARRWRVRSWRAAVSRLIKPVAPDPARLRRWRMTPHDTTCGPCPADSHKGGLVMRRRVSKRVQRFR